MRKIVNSVENQTIKRAVALQHKKYRAEYKQCLVEGLRAITTCLQAGWRLEQLFVTQTMLPELSEQLAGRAVIVTDAIMKKISRMITPAGVLAIFDTPNPPHMNKLGSGLVLAQLQDPGNVGTLIRTAAALAMRTVILVESVDPWSPKVIQATAGAIALVDVYNLSWQEVVKYKHALKLCALVVAGGNSIQNADLRNTLLVVGREAHGLPEAWQKDYDEQVTLPMPGGTESLNAGVAGSIALYIAYLQKM